MEEKLVSESSQHRPSLNPERLAVRGFTIDHVLWRWEFDTWLKQNSEQDTTGAIILNLQRCYLTYPIDFDEEEFSQTFGSILKFRQDIRILATKVVLNIKIKYALNIDLKRDILQKAFFVAHLRTEKHAVKAWPVEDWGYAHYQAQSRAYLSQDPRSNLVFIYIASSSLSEVTRFAQDSPITPPNLLVMTKFDILEGEDLVELKALKWDQQAMVDFMVALKASDFAGIGHSSFT